MSIDFNTSLLREKFVIRDKKKDNPPAKMEEVVALSNRMALSLYKDALTHERFVVRAQNMHSCVRMSALIAREFLDHGPLMERRKEFNWDSAYHTITKGYEESWNKNIWIAVYFEGKQIFCGGGENKPHPFFDIIEQCDNRNQGDYTKALTLAKEAFIAAGKPVDIEYDSNVALVVNLTPEEAKCGLILRAPHKTTTFNMTIKKKNRAVWVSSTLSAAAAFLEGIQLAFMVGMTRQKRRYDLINSASDENQKGEDASEKLGRLNRAIDQFESLYRVAYRPERPNFSELVIDAEEFARTVLGQEIKDKIESGEEDAGDWVL